MTAPRLRHISCFLEIARLGNLSAAADTLAITQPAASRTLRELEESLDVRLFDRSNRRMILTSAGRIYQKHASIAMQELRLAQHRVGKASVAKTRVAVGALPTAATDLLPKAALGFRNLFPCCILRIATGPNWLLLNQLRIGDLDLMVGRMAAPESMDGLTFQQLYVEEIVAVVRPAHPLLEEAPVDPVRLGQFPLILPPRGALINGAVQAFLISHDMQTIEPAFENVSLAFGRKVVVLSNAVWLISRGVVSEELNAGVLQTLDLRGSGLMAGPIGISLRSSVVLSSETRALIKVITEAVGSSHPAL